MQKTLRQQIEEIGVLKAGWTTFGIKFKKNIEYGGEACMGLTDFDSCEILLREINNDDVIRATMIHEMWHVIFSTMGVRADDEDAHTQLVRTNEFLVEQATRGSLLFKQLNPQLWKALYG